MVKKGGKKKTFRIEKVKELLLAEDMQTYAKITKCLGDRKMILILPDKSEIMGLIPGRFRKRVWMNTGDIVLVSYREFESTKVDIIHKYSSEDTKKLVKLNEIPGFFLYSEFESGDELCEGINIMDESEFNIDDL